MIPQPSDLFLSCFSERGMEWLFFKLCDTHRQSIKFQNHGDFPTWQAALVAMPHKSTRHIKLDQAVIEIGTPIEASRTEQNDIKRQLMQLRPWRKGPFNWFGVALDAEWQSNIKWNRVAEAISPLTDRLVLDVGAGNGYSSCRMLGAGAKLVLGIESELRFVAQFYAAQQYMLDLPIYVYPCRLETCVKQSLAFDTVFSMGVIYHARDPLRHLKYLCDCLRSGGELVLESLVLDSKDTFVLEPANRYAKMKNIYKLPSYSVLLEWVVASGFRLAEIVDITPTTTTEQRATEWMGFESLEDFLDPTNPTLTIEGYPAPMRAILIAQKP